MTKVNKEPLLGQIWVLKSQILVWWNFWCKFSLSKFRLMLWTCVRWEFASNLPHSTFHFSIWLLPLNWRLLTTYIWCCCVFKLVFGLDMFDSWFWTCSILFEQDWMRGTVIFEICTDSEFCCQNRCSRILAWCRKCLSVVGCGKSSTEWVLDVC